MLKKVTKDFFYLSTPGSEGDGQRGGGREEKILLQLGRGKMSGAHIPQQGRLAGFFVYLKDRGGGGN